MDSDDLTAVPPTSLPDEINEDVMDIGLTSSALSLLNGSGLNEDLTIFPALGNFRAFPSPSSTFEYSGAATQPQDAGGGLVLGTRNAYESVTLEMSPGNATLPLNSLRSLSSCSTIDGSGSPGISEVSLGASYAPIQSPVQYESPSRAFQGSSSGTASNKHLCAICGDRASGKHYGVYSCEGCKGFFKRTVRKELQYACRDDRSCPIDKRQRNRCQYCRYQKCLMAGMKREAVQEERQRAREKGESELEGTAGANNEMPVEEILQAELALDPHMENYLDAGEEDPMATICHAADKQLFSLVTWAKRIPHFLELSSDDQVSLLRAGWNELLIAGFSHRSTVVRDCILLATGVRVHRQSAHNAGFGVIFDRVLKELINKMRDLAVDKTELGCLRAIILYNPDARGLKSVSAVESLREKVYASLDEYCRLQYPDDTSRFAQLLLRLPALRSIGLKCIEHLFFIKLFGATPLDSFLLEMLESSEFIHD